MFSSFARIWKSKSGDIHSWRVLSEVIAPKPCLIRLCRSSFLKLIRSSWVIVEFLRLLIRLAWDSSGRGSDYVMASLLRFGLNMLLTFSYNGSTGTWYRCNSVTFSFCIMLKPLLAESVARAWSPTTSLAGLTLLMICCKISSFSGVKSFKLMIS